MAADARNNQKNTPKNAPKTPQNAPLDPNKKVDADQWELVKTLAIAVVLAVVFRSFLFEPFHIPSGSMKETLLVGDYIFVSKYSYGYSRYSFPLGFRIFDGRILGSEPERGDVIVFRQPIHPKIDFVKRLVGLPGDRIQVKEGVLYINGTAVPRVADGEFNEPGPFDTTSHVPVYTETLPNGVSYHVLDETPLGDYDNTEEVTVPEGHYFMMGDNRDNSNDSRTDEVGFVPAENLVGRAEVLWFSADGTAPFWKPIKWLKSLRYERFFKERALMWDALEKTLEYSFTNRALLEEALTHPSLRIHDRNRADYERLEFLGDAVLGLVIAKLIYGKYPNEREGELARRHAALVCGLATTQVAQKLGLGNYLQMADGERSSGGQENGANLEDACEALMGAIYLDGGLEAAEKIILRYWEPMADSLIEPPKDPKSALQEWAQGGGKPLPTYSVLSQEGPDHALQFEVKVEVEGGQSAIGSGSSKRAAEREAAEKLLEKIRGN